MLRDRLRTGVGVDYEHAYVVDARRRGSEPARREYRRLGHTVVQDSAEYLMTEGGFRSEHFTKTRLQSLVGDRTIRPGADIAYIVTF